ncbi:BMP family protein [Paenibacillus thailandensis]|uniref:BMP family protein n=1 Tax=Paenibacillus thailandensis TaxID=393250 RepID=A0ABW5R395_9BACL
MKKWTGLIMFLLLAVIVAGCGSNNGGGNAAANAGASADAGSEPSDNASGEKKRIVLVTPEKIGVNQFFTQMEDGLKQAAEEFGFEYQIVESTDPTQVEQNLRAVVAEKYDLIITAAYTAADALTKVAAENPEQPFAIIDTVVDAPNVRSIEFREHEAAYLMGALAGLSTKTNTVGAVVAMETPLLGKYTSGFEQGLKSVNPEAKFLVNYVGSFTDPAKAKELALLQNSQGADFVAGMSAVGDSGVFEAAKEKGFYTAGQDTDRTVEDPEHVVLSQLKETDTVTYETAKDFMEGNFSYGSASYGLKENGVGITFVTAETESPLSDFIGQANVDKVKQIRDDIVSGKIEVKNPMAE